MFMLTERLANVLVRHARRRGLSARRVEDIGGFYVTVITDGGERVDFFDWDEYRDWLRTPAQPSPTATN